MGHVTIRRDDADWLRVDWCGRISVDDFARAEAALRAEFSRPTRFVVTDTAKMTGFESTLRRPMAELVRWMREHGLERMFALSASPLLRVTGTTVALMARVPLTFVENELDARRQMSASPRRQAS